MRNDTTPHQEKQIDILIDAAKKLDEACTSGEIPTNNIKKLKVIITNASDELRHKKYAGPLIFIIYESGALLSWVQGDEYKTREQLKSAIDIMKSHGRSSRGFITESAKTLYEALDIEDYESPQALKKDTNDKSQKTISQYAQQIGQLTPRELAVRIISFIAVAAIFIIYIILFLGDMMYG